MSTTAAGEATSPRTLHRVGAVIGLTAVLSATLLIGAPAQQAHAYTWGWPTWLAGHPELTVTEMPKGFITGTKAQVARASVAGKTPAGALAAGAFILGYEGSTAFLNWQFGPDGDNRSYNTAALPSPYAWGTEYGNPMPLPQHVRNLVLAAQEQYGNTKTEIRVVNTGGAAVYNELQYDCRNDSTGALIGTTYNPGRTNDPGPLGTNTGRNLFNTYYCASGQHVSRVAWVGYAGISYTDPTTIYEWVYEHVAQPWTVNVTQHCRGESGPGTSTSTPYTVTPVANATASLEVPACPAGMEPEAVSLDGGRTGTETGILVAIPQDRTEEAEVTPPPPNTDPVDPVPGTIGAGTTVTNPDGSTTVTQTQTMPDGTTRTVTTTTYPDGSKTITTQPLNPDGTPQGAPAVVNIPAPGTGEQTDPDDANCMDGAFGWNPLSWVYTPVKCALQWAFVPPPGSLEAAFGGIGDAWDGTAIGTFGGMLGDVFGPIGDLATMESDGCVGPLVTIPLPVGPDLSIRPLNVCNDLAQYVLGFWMPAASAGIYLATFFGIYHGFGRALGLSTPVVRAKGA